MPKAKEFDEMTSLRWTLLEPDSFSAWELDY
jgi:hypothetical protein